MSWYPTPDGGVAWARSVVKTRQQQIYHLFLLLILARSSERKEKASKGRSVTRTVLLHTEVIR